MNINGTIEVIKETSRGLSSGDWVAIVVAIASLVATLIATGLTNKATKELGIKNEKMQISMNERNIDANLKAKARIEWIQNVRNATAELIALGYSIFITPKDTPVLSTESMIKFQEKIELLILFFGPDKKNNEMKDSAEKFVKTDYNSNMLIVNEACERQLLNEDSNENKNDIIVLYWMGYNKLDRFFKGIYNNIR